VAALLAVAATGCGGHRGAASDPHGLNWKQYNGEYFRETHKLQLAPGFRWPARAPIAGSYQGAAVYFEAGSGKRDADRYWLCSWARRWLGDRGSSVALRKLWTIKRTFLYQGATLPHDRHLYDDEITRAGLGDAGPLQNDVQLNCPKPA